MLNECNIVLNSPACTSFFQVMQFLLRQKHTKKYILVHCTHGHNRTGYMIAHYLMRSQPMSVTQVSFQCLLSRVSQLVLFYKSLF
jgi:protein-tyrosine phosphatase